MLGNDRLLDDCGLHWYMVVGRLCGIFVILFIAVIRIDGLGCGFAVVFGCFVEWWLACWLSFMVALGVCGVFA